MENDKIFKILEHYKKFVGFADWNILITRDLHDMEDWAEISLNEYKKEAKIKLSKKLFKEHDSFIKNVLVHELIHGRYLLFTLQYEDLLNRHEELFINDVTTMVLNSDSFESNLSVESPQNNITNSNTK